MFAIAKRKFIVDESWIYDSVSSETCEWISPKGYMGLTENWFTGLKIVHGSINKIVKHGLFYNFEKNVLINF